MTMMGVSSPTRDRMRPRMGSIFMYRSATTSFQVLPSREDHWLESWLAMTSS